MKCNVDELCWMQIDGLVSGFDGTMCFGLIVDDGGVWTFELECELIVVLVGDVDEEIVMVDLTIGIRDHGDINDLSCVDGLDVELEGQ